MKTKITLIIAMAACLLLAKVSHAQIDLVPGINYSYNPPGSNCIITNITVDVCNNDNGNASSFDVSMYLYDQSTSNYWIIGTTRLNNGLSGNSCITISNWDIDISQTSGIPNGTYRLGIWVDSGTEITETDENNNTGLLSGNINYSCGSAGVEDAALYISQVNLFPNPAQSTTVLSYSLLQNAAVSIELYDVTGKKVDTIESSRQPAGNYSLTYDAGRLENGIYFVRITVNGACETRKLTVAR